MGNRLDSLQEELESGLDETLEVKDREILTFTKELKASKRFRLFGNSARAGIDLYIKAYEGNEVTVMALSLSKIHFK